MNAREKGLSLALVCASCAFCGGCVVPYYSLQDRIPDELVQRLKAGTMTRADVLMALGDPTRRIEDDRYFFYEWLEIPAALYLWLAMVPMGSDNALAIEFAPDGTIARLEKLSTSATTTVDKLVKEWMKAHEGVP